VDATDHHAKNNSNLNPPDDGAVGNASVVAMAKRDGWWIDSGATFHFTPYANDFEEPLQTPEVRMVRVGDGFHIKTQGMGRVRVKGHNGKTIILTKVHLVKELHTRLLSVLHLMTMGYKVVFNPPVACTVSKGRTIFMTGKKAAGPSSGLVFMDLALAPRYGKPLAGGLADAAMVHYCIPTSDKEIECLGSSTQAPKTSSNDSKTTAVANVVSSSFVPYALAHQRLGHVAPSTLKKMHDAEAVTGLKLQGKPEDMPPCEHCLIAKSHRQPFPKSSLTPITFVLELVSADLWGPVRVPSVGGKARYVLSLGDHATGWIWAYPTKDKESKTIAQIFKMWMLKSERKANRRLGTLRTDNGKEFQGEVLKWINLQGIAKQRSAPYDPQQNGHIERWHRTMGEGMRSLLLSSGMPVEYWAEALRHIVVCKNRTAYSALRGCTTPFGAWHKRKPDLSMLRVWGCMGCVRLPDREQQGKLGPRGVMCIHLGVDEEAKAWRMLDPDILRVRISRHVDFMEHVLWKQWAAERTGGKLRVENPEAVYNLLPPTQLPTEPELEVIQDLGGEVQPLVERTILPVPYEPLGEIPEVGEELEEEQTLPPAPTPQRQSMRQLLQEQIQPQQQDALPDAIAETVWAMAAIGEYPGPEPTTAAQALSGPDKDLWRASIDAEMEAMAKFGVWDHEPVELPPGKKALDTKLVFKEKTDEEGKVYKHKSRLVVRGFSQVPGTDFGETYSSVAKLVTVRLLFALAAINDWEVDVIDVDNAFLNATLKEEIYIKQPAGADDGTGRVLRLRMALYGLKQASKEWKDELETHLTGNGFEPTHSDDALYTKWKGDDFAFLSVFVDDCMNVGRDRAQLQKTKEMLASKYKIKDLGPVSTYLGMQVRRDIEAGWLELSQEKYVKGLSEKFSDILEGTSKVKTPMAPDILHKIRNGGWTSEEAERANRTLYMSLIGSLMYAATATRPDIAFTVNTLAQASVDPRQIHLIAATRALRYLVDTANLALRYDREQGTEVVGYSDSDWANEPDASSRAAYVFKLGGGAISWATKKVECISDSSAVAEYKALSLATKEAIWLRQLLGELKQSTRPITLMVDNQSAINMAKSKGQHQKTKHVKIAWHLAKQAMKVGDIQVKFVGTRLQDADMLTKAVDAVKHKDNGQRLGLVPKTYDQTSLSALVLEELSD
jgi:hypothetical protein